MCLATALFVSCTSSKSPVDYVNPNMGNISHLLVPTYPTVHIPNGMIRMYAMRDGFQEDRIGGFPLTIGSHRLGDVFAFQPYTEGEGRPAIFSGSYRYDNEKSRPYDYSVWLDDYDVTVRFAPAERAAIFEANYQSGTASHFRIATVGAGEISVDGKTIQGFDTFRGVKVYVYGEVNRDPVKTQTAQRNAPLADATSIAGNRVAVDLTFEPKENAPVVFRYGISFVSADQAKQNLGKEVRTWQVDDLALIAKKKWNDALGKIEIKSDDEDIKTVFYTSLYRSYERPVNINEYGQYFSGYDNQVHKSEFDFYVDDWCWDTYLALHPLHVILNKEMQENKVRSFIAMYQQSGAMPTFPVVSGDAHFMNGNHYAPVIWDAWCKGYRDFDLKTAFEGSKYTALNRTMIPWIKGPICETDSFYHANGWYPSLQPGEPEYLTNISPFENRQAVTLALAASYDDWCIAQMAKELGNQADYELFMKRSLNYRNHWNKETGFFAPKDKDGNWIEPFDPIKCRGVGAREYFAENNAWTYIWDVHHNIADLVDLFGSKERFEEKLDRLFVEPIPGSRWNYYSYMPDATGGVGQFVMGNEPSFHIPYLYNYVGSPWKTQKRVRSLLNMWFRNDLMGIPGDEDGGGMSAFYVFSAMGFYPVTPGLPMYVIGSPNLDYAKIDLGNGKKFEMVATNNSAENKYIQTVRFNGKEWNKTWFTHDDLMQGGKIEFVMGKYPNKQWGVGEGAIPPSYQMPEE